MKRKTVSEFWKEMTGETGSLVHRVTPVIDSEERKRINLECTDLGVALLLSVAKLSQHFADYPDWIPLEGDNRMRADYGLRRDAIGMWRISGNLDAMLDQMIEGRHSMHPRWLVSDSLVAMGVPHTMDSHDVIADLLTWGRADLLREQVTRISGTVPRHTLYSALSHGNKMANYFEVPATQDFARSMVDLVDSLGIDLDAQDMPDVFPALIRLAQNSDSRFVEEMLRFGASPVVQYGNLRADFIAALNGNAATLSLICDRMPDVNGTNEFGENLLNQVLHRLNDPDNALVPPMVKYLLDKGVDPTHPDSYGKTAAEAVEDRLEIHEKLHKDSPWLLKAIEETKEIVEAACAPGLNA